MQLVAPAGPVYHAGTLSGNPLALRAGITTLRIFKDPGVWTKLDAAASKLTSGLERAAKRAGVPVQTTRVGKMFTMFFSERQPRT